MKSKEISKPAKQWIEKLNLKPHPEGGYFREFFRSDIQIYAENLPYIYTTHRSSGTAIYFLLDQNDFSAFHRLKTGELWYLLDGSSVRIHILEKEDRKILDLDKSQPVVHVPANRWFAAEIVDKSRFALMSCVVMPGFEFEDLEIADYESLIREFPENKDIIKRLTHTEYNQAEKK